MAKLRDKYTVDYIRKNDLILLEVIIGSHAFNLTTPDSDVDKYGVFFLEKEDYLSLQYRTENFKEVIGKDHDDDPDISFVELGKFIEQLASNNPNALEILASSKINENIIYAHPMIHKLDINKIISKECKDSFGAYAKGQINKARGKNKKIVNPVPEKRKTPLDFCYIFNENKTMSLKKYLKDNNYEQLFCGLVNLPNARDSYALFYDIVSHNCFSNFVPDDHKEGNKHRRRILDKPLGYGFKGIEKEGSSVIRLSSIPKKEEVGEDIGFIGHISYNKDGYTSYCKDYKEYWEWVEKRNPKRYLIASEKGYDVKNMTHCVRLLTVAREIGMGDGIIIRRTEDKDFLMSIKTGKLEYDEVLNYAENIIESLDIIYDTSSLPKRGDYQYLNNFLIEFRKVLY